MITYKLSEGEVFGNQRGEPFLTIYDTGRSIGCIPVDFANRHFREFWEQNKTAEAHLRIDMSRIKCKSEHMRPND